MDQGALAAQRWRLPCSARPNSRKLIMGQVSHRRSLLKRYQWQSSRFGLENANPLKPGLHADFALEVWSFWCPLCFRRRLSSALFRHCLNQGYFNFYFNTLVAGMDSKLMSFFWHKLILLTLLFCCCCCCCLFVLFCFLLLIHKRFTQNFRLSFTRWSCRRDLWETNKIQRWTHKKPKHRSCNIYPLSQESNTKGFWDHFCPCNWPQLRFTGR